MEDMRTTLQGILPQPQGLHHAPQGLCDSDQLNLDLVAEVLENDGFSEAQAEATFTNMFSDQATSLPYPAQHNSYTDMQGNYGLTDLQSSSVYDHQQMGYDCTSNQSSLNQGWDNYSDQDSIYFGALVPSLQETADLERRIGRAKSKKKSSLISGHETGGFAASDLQPTWNYQNDGHDLSLELVNPNDVLPLEASGNRLHAGYNDVWSQDNSDHNEGYSDHNEGYSSHSEGCSSHSEGYSSHSEGYGCYSDSLSMSRVGTAGVPYDPTLSASDVPQLVPSHDTFGSSQATGTCHDEPGPVLAVGGLTQSAGAAQLLIGDTAEKDKHRGAQGAKHRHTRQLGLQGEAKKHRKQKLNNEACQIYRSKKKNVLKTLETQVETMENRNLQLRVCRQTLLDARDLIVHRIAALNLHPDGRLPDHP